MNDSNKIGRSLKKTAIEMLTYIRLSFNRNENKKLCGEPPREVNRFR